MTMLTLDQLHRLNREAPLFRTLGLGTLLNNGNTLFHAGRLATGHVRVGTNPNDADTFTLAVGPTTVDGVFVPGSTSIYEIDTGNGVVAGHVLVTRGGNAAATATALAAAIMATQGTQVVAAAHATDTTVVDVRHRAAGGTLTLSTSSGGRMLVQNNAETLTKDQYVMYLLNRTVTAEDATRTRLRIDTGLSSLAAHVLRIATSVSSNAELAWDGTKTVTGGVIELTVGSSAPLAAGQLVQLVAIGQP